MKEKGLIEQIGEDRVFEFGDEYNDSLVTDVEQNETLSRRREIIEEGSKQESTRMHKFTFKPTEKYKKILQEKVKRRAKKDVDDMEEI